MKIKNQQIMFDHKTILIVLVYLLSLSQSKCSDQPKCFKKALFNYNLPDMDLYPMNGTDNNLIQYSIKAYGDFNNDLYTDFIGVNQNREILVFVWNSDTLLYEKVFQTQMVESFIPKSIYLLDINADGMLDFAVWGIKNLQQGQPQNSLVSYIQQSIYIFKNTTMLKMIQTSDPIIIGYRFTDETDGVGFLLYMNGERVFLTYNHQQKGDSSFKVIKWSNKVQSSEDFSRKPFHHPHWNTLVDLTGDCIPELVLMNQDKKIEIWIGDSKKFKFYGYHQIDSEHQNLTLSGYAFNDLNYDGGIDFIIVFQKTIRVHLNHRGLTSEDQFCCQQCTNFQLDDPIDIDIPQDKTIKQQALHFGDINIDGYPDLLIVLVDDTTKIQTPTLFENLFDSTNSFAPFKTPTYNNRLAVTPEKSSVLSVSFLDILQNGILDIIVSYSKEGRVQTLMYYNNFLFQNDFYIKGFGLFGQTIEIGSQFPGISFYWINSANDGFKVTYQAQITQTSYDALQMPYTFCGLGRANNYVQSFTVGRNGQKKDWSPIIPNSQLGVSTINENQDSWKIRIFAFPFYEFITVIIVTGIILTIFGVFLMYVKCKGYKKKQEPLEIQFIN